MIDKADIKVPFSADFRPEFKFVLGELKYAGFSSSVMFEVLQRSLRPSPL